MAKELGQIHTINKTFSTPALSQASTPFILGDVDLPGELSEQLQRVVRAGCYYKTVGIDMSLGLNHDLNNAFTVSGQIRYYAPTQGRCEAFRSAFKAMADQMTMQGISMRDNPLYDFRVPLNESAPTTFRNQATLDGVDGIALNNASDGLGVFQVHNAGVRPQYEGTADDLYSQGYKTLLNRSTSRTDFVLNDTVLYTGNEMIASLDYETIPFQLSFATGNDDNDQTTSTFQFRPDPALYLAVMCGQFQILIDDMSTFASISGEQVEINVAVHVSGWKSIMGNPNKKKKSSKKRSRK